MGSCQRCAAELHGYREMRVAMSAAQLRFTAPIGLRRRIERVLPSSSPRISSRRSILKGFAMGTALSHVINLFVAQGPGPADHDAKLETMQGFNVQRWSAQGLEFFAVSDLNADELQDFIDKFESALRSTNGT